MTSIIVLMSSVSFSTPPSTTTRPVPLCSASFITSFVWLPFLASCVRKTNGYKQVGFVVRRLHNAGYKYRPLSRVFLELVYLRRASKQVWLPMHEISWN